MAKTNDRYGLQVFPRADPEILPESRESQEGRDGSEPVRTPPDSPQEDGKPGSRPAQRPAEHTPGPWEVVHHGAGDLSGVTIRRAITSGEYVAEVHANKGDDAREVSANIRLIAASPQLLDSLSAMEWAGSGEDEVGDYTDECPNCGASAADAEAPAVFDGLHFVGCELRDALDAALGVTTERAARAGVPHA